MIVGVLIGTYLPVVPQVLGSFTLYNVSIPTTILLWIMIYPMLLKIDFKSVKNIGKNPGGPVHHVDCELGCEANDHVFDCVLFFFVVYGSFMDPSSAASYLAGAVLLRRRRVRQWCSCGVS